MLLQSANGLHTGVGRLGALGGKVLSEKFWLTLAQEILWCQRGGKYRHAGIQLDTH